MKSDDNSCIVCSGKTDIPNEISQLSELDKIKKRWKKKYPHSVGNCENDQKNAHSFFQFSNDTQRIMYTPYMVKDHNSSVYHYLTFLSKHQPSLQMAFRNRTSLLHKMKTQRQRYSDVLIFPTMLHVH